MNRQIKIIWDFFGKDAEGTAKHHLRHLLEFLTKNNISLIASGIGSEADFHFLAYLTVNESDVKLLRDALKPHRAFVVAE